MKPQVFKISLLILLILALLSVFLPDQKVNAANILVTTSVDETTTNNLCSLREAIRNANEKGKTFPDCDAGTGVDTITFDTGITVITLGNGLPQIKEILTIDGAGVVTISGGGITDIFKVQNLATLTLYRITIANGNNAGNGGGVNSNGNLIVQKSRFENNSAAIGGAIYASGGSATIEDTTFINNSAQTSGGSVALTTGTNNLTNDLFSGSSAGAGGGILVGSGATLIATNLTLFNNQASDTLGNGGGGLLVTGGTVTITNVTFANNGSAAVGGGISRTGGAVTLKNTIVANNTGGNCSGTPTDGGGNLVYGDTSCPGTNANPNLQVLADNGGFTHTMALGSGSGAVNLASSISCPAVDQRGMNRRSGYCDSGAFEAQPAALVAFSGTPQYAVIGYPFHDALVTKVMDAYSNPLGGLIVDFSAPASGASANLSSSSETTNQAGTASVNATANNTTGDYNITASSGTLTPVNFVLSNVEVVVSSISRSGVNPTNTASVDFTVLFSVAVDGVSLDDFDLTVGGSVTGASVAGISGSDTTYTVSVNTGSGDGTIRLDLVDDDSITDKVYGFKLGGDGLLNGDYSTGEVFDIDRTMPVVTITSGPDNLTTATTAVFEFAANETVSGYECSLDNGAFAVCSSPVNYNTLADGAHSFTVQATDLAGNNGQSTAPYTWTVDSTKPTAVMDPLPVISPEKFTISWSGSDATSGVGSYDIEYQEDGGVWTPLLSGTTDLSVFFTGLANHTYTFHVRATDNAGNVGDWSPTVETQTKNVVYLPFIQR